MSNFMSPSCCALLFIDWQERLFPAMPEGLREQNLRNAENLGWLANKLDVPVIFSEQYPKGLGTTIASLMPSGAIEKVSFSACKNQQFVDAVQAANRPTMIISGMETHICVAQTAQDLSQSGYNVVVATDGVLSRKKLDWKMGLQRMVSVGCRLTTTEAVLFEWLGASGTPLFKELSKRIR